MAAVVLLGKSAPFVDASFSRSSSLPLDSVRSGATGKGRLCPNQDAAFLWFGREPCAAAATSSSSASTCPWRSSVASGPRRPAANFASGGFEGGGESDEEDDGSENWEDEMRNRLKEMEDMKELERRAEELQNSMMAGGGSEDGETEEEKRERVRKELEKLAKEQAERRETAKLMFDIGQKAYGKGLYSRSIEFFEGALTIIPRLTLLGGEIQIWLAMAYEANKRHKDCIELYRELEKKHPSVSIRRQAAELRYILQAPKLKITKEEMVTIPLIGSNFDRYAGTWSDKYKEQDRRKKVTTSDRSSSRDYWGDFIGWRPPAEWEKSRAFWFAVTLLSVLVGVALLQS